MAQAINDYVESRRIARLSHEPVLPPDEIIVRSFYGEAYHQAHYGGPSTTTVAGTATAAGGTIPAAATGGTMPASTQQSAGGTATGGTRPKTTSPTEEGAAGGPANASKNSGTLPTTGSAAPSAATTTLTVGSMTFTVSSTGRGGGKHTLQDVAAAARPPSMFPSVHSHDTSNASHDTTPPFAQLRASADADRRQQLRFTMGGPPPTIAAGGDPTSLGGGGPKGTPTGTLRGEGSNFSYLNGSSRSGVGAPAAAALRSTGNTTTSGGGPSGGRKGSSVVPAPRNASLQANGTSLLEGQYVISTSRLLGPQSPHAPRAQESSAQAHGSPSSSPLSGSRKIAAETSVLLPPPTTRWFPEQAPPPVVGAPMDPMNINRNIYNDIMGAGPRGGRGDGTDAAAATTTSSQQLQQQRLRSAAGHIEAKKRVLNEVISHFVPDLDELRANNSRGGRRRSSQRGGSAGSRKSGGGGSRPGSSSRKPSTPQAKISSVKSTASSKKGGGGVNGTAIASTPDALAEIILAEAAAATSGAGLPGLSGAAIASKFLASLNTQTPPQAPSGIPPPSGPAVNPNALPITPFALLPGNLKGIVPLLAARMDDHGRISAVNFTKLLAADFGIHDAIVADNSFRMLESSGHPGYVLVGTAIAAFHEVLNGPQTKAVVSGACFDLFNLDNRGYIHRGHLQELKVVSAPLAHHTLCTPMMVKVLSDLFENIRLREEEHYINTVLKKKKGGGKKKLPQLKSNQRSVIPVERMTISHIPLSLFSAYWATHPELAPAFAPRWLPMMDTNEAVSAAARDAADRYEEMVYQNLNASGNPAQSVSQSASPTPPATAGGTFGGTD